MSPHTDHEYRRRVWLIIGTVYAIISALVIAGACCDRGARVHSPQRMAEHLSRSISDASTIRAQVALWFGADKAPHLSLVQDYVTQRTQERKQAAERRKRWFGKPQRNDGEDFDPRIKFKPKPVEPEPLPVPKELRIDRRVIVKGVASDFRISSDDIYGKSRKRTIVHARAVIAKLMADRKMSASWTGRFLGRRDHSSILHSLRMFDTYERVNPLVTLSYERWRDK